MKLLLLTILFSVTSFNIDCKDKFEITNATMQNWYGGRPETGKGTYYELTIHTKVNSENLLFDQMWIDSEYFEIQCYQKGKRVKNNTFGPGDIVTITVNKKTGTNHIQNRDEGDHKADPDPPHEYKGEALLSYVYNSKRKYKVIEKFTKLEDLRYP